MNLLYLAHRLPYPPDKGDKLRAFRHLQHLAERHDVWCACFADDPRDMVHGTVLKEFCADVAVLPLSRAAALVRGGWGWVRGSTVTESFYHHAGMNEMLRRWCRTNRFDAVVAFSSSMAPYALRIRARRRVLDLCDCDSEKWSAYARTARGPLRILYRSEGRRLRMRERGWANAFDATVLITESEAKLLQPYAARGKLHVVSNGVDLPSDAPDRAGVFAHSGVVGFVGVMDYRPNVEAVRWFVEQCWREIRAACPQATLRIVGRRPTRAVQALARRPGVEVVGEVPDAQAEVRRFAVSVAPLRIARGLPNKVLEAMAVGVPVVVSAAAAAAVQFRDGRDCRVADTPDQTVRAVVRLLRDPAERARLGQAGRDFVTRRHRWEDHLTRFEAIVIGPTARSTQAATVAVEPYLSPSADALVASSKVVGDNHGFADALRG